MGDDNDLPMRQEAVACRTLGPVVADELRTRHTGKLQAWVTRAKAPDLRAERCRLFVGYKIGWNCYGAAGQVVPHAHLHVLLRFKDEPCVGKGQRWFLRQDDNLRPDPSALGTGARDFQTSL